MRLHCPRQFPQLELARPHWPTHLVSFSHPRGRQVSELTPEAWFGGARESASSSALDPKMSWVKPPGASRTRRVGLKSEGAVEDAKISIRAGANRDDNTRTYRRVRRAQRSSKGLRRREWNLRRTCRTARNLPFSKRWRSRGA